MTPAERTVDNQGAKRRKIMRDESNAREAGPASSLWGVAPPQEGEVSPLIPDMLTAYSTDDSLEDDEVSPLIQPTLYSAPGGILVDENGYVVDEEGNKKPRAEMTPAERVMDNQGAKRRKRMRDESNASGANPRRVGPSHGGIAPPVQQPKLRSAPRETGLLVDDAGKVVDEMGNRKPRADMTAEERQYDNQSNKMRKRQKDMAGDAGVQDSSPPYQKGKGKGAMQQSHVFSAPPWYSEKGFGTAFKGKGKNDGKGWTGSMGSFYAGVDTFKGPGKYAPKGGKGSMGAFGMNFAPQFPQPMWSF